MTKNQYRTALDKLGLTQGAAAEVLGIDARTSRRYALNEASIPAPVAKLLRVMISRNIPADEIKKL